MKRRVSIVFIICISLTLTCLVSACKKQEVGSDADGFTGVYTLVSVNGNAVPASVSHQGVMLQVRSGEFAINADGTCKSKTVFVPPGGNEVTREVNATYTKDGMTLTMKWEGAGITVGTVEGDEFTMDNEGMIFVYKK
jgi:hypothetical protein